MLVQAIRVAGNLPRRTKRRETLNGRQRGIYSYAPEFRKGNPAHSRLGDEGYFMRDIWILMLLIISLVSPQAGAGAADSPIYQSPFIRAEFAPDRPALTALAVDSLGKGKLGGNLLAPTLAAAVAFKVRARRAKSGILAGRGGAPETARVDIR